MADNNMLLAQFKALLAHAERLEEVLSTIEDANKPNSLSSGVESSSFGHTTVNYSDIVNISRELLVEIDEHALTSQDASEVCVSALETSATNTVIMPDLPYIQIGKTLDEVDADVWGFIYAHATRVAPVHGRIESYAYDRGNGGVIVLWEGDKLKALTVSVRDGLNRTATVYASDDKAEQISKDS